MGTMTALLYRLKRKPMLLALLCALTIQPVLTQTETTATERRALAEELIRRGLVNRVAAEASFATVPRHRFISGSPQALAYQDTPLPLGDGRFLAAPGELAGMIAAAGDLSGKRVLVAGPESGYLSALVSRLAAETVQYEFIPNRAEEFARLYSELGYRNIDVRIGEEALRRDSLERFDVILLGYGSNVFPLPVVARLNDSGVLIGALSFDRGEQLLAEYRRSRNAASVRIIGRVFFPGS